MWGGRGGKARTGKGKRNELGQLLQLEAGTCGREQRAVARVRPHGEKARPYVQLKLEVTVDHVCVQKGHGSGPCPKTQLRLTDGDRDSSLHCTELRGAPNFLFPASFLTFRKIWVVFAGIDTRIF